MQIVIISTLVIGVIGMLIGVGLGIAGKKFEVPVDEKEVAVRALLPGNNCGGCGYAGCDALAKAIALGEAPAGACPVGGENVAKAISEVMGVEGGNTVRQVAFVKCSGTCDKTELQYHYYGIHDCAKLALVPGRGDKKCAFGCMGYGSCVKACPFDAIHVIGGVAKVDSEKCKACGKCIAICPNHLIELVPYEAQHLVACSSADKGKDTRQVCSTGCIGCGICVKQCEAGAVTVENNLAHIDQEKCTHCGKCAEKCPSKIIL